MSASVTIPQEVLDRIRALCLALPEVTVRVDESRTSARSTAWSFDIRRRSFCLLVAVKGRDDEPAPRLALRVDPRDRQALVSFGHPYFSLLAPKKLAAQLDHSRAGDTYIDGPPGT